MQQNFSRTKLPTVGSSSSVGGAPAWSNPNRITADDGSAATWNAVSGADMSSIGATTFAFGSFPPGTVIDGIQVFVDGSQTGCYGLVNLILPTAVTVPKSIGSLFGGFGSNTDLWGADSVPVSDLASIALSISANDESGGDGFASIDYVSITVFYHVELTALPADVPTRVDYKVYSSEGRYLGLLPKVTSKYAYAQDINSPGSSIIVTCGKFVDNEVTVLPLQTEAGDPITTESDIPIYATETDMVFALGNSPDDAIFKNGNRVKIWIYNQYYPNGKLDFSGQMNRVDFKYGGGDATARVTIYSDGQDTGNYIARGYPFSYTPDVTQTTQNSYLSVTQEGDKGAGWLRWGQTVKVGASVSNMGAISLMLQGTADVTLLFYDAPNGNLLGSTTRSIADGSPTVEQFEYSQLLTVTPGSEVFFAIAVGQGQSINVYYNTSSVYADGTLYQSSYAGGSGGTYTPTLGDLYFITKSGVPTTTATYSTDDPTSDMAHGIFLDYNNRGGLLRERDFTPTGLSLTYTFVVAFIADALKKIIEMCPAGFYSYVDLGTSEIDILDMNTNADYTVVRGRHINELTIGLTIEQVKNYLLLTGGDVGGGVNLYRDYQDSESSGNFGLRTAPKSDNRITLTPTADAIGTSFIEENAGEKQETSLIVLNSTMDITLLKPGKTIGFKNFGNFIDDMVLPIVRREPNYSDGYVRLSLGLLPIRMSDEIQRLNREVLNEQTIANPTAPS